MRYLIAIVLSASSAAVFAQAAPDLHAARAPRTAPAALAESGASAASQASRTADERARERLDEAARRAEVDALEPAANVRPTRERSAAEPAPAASAQRAAPPRPEPATSPRAEPAAPLRTEPAASPRALAAGASARMDRVDLGTTSITGNQELPKVLYIVPWKRSDLGDLVGRPVNTLLDEVLSPVDPDVFKRHLEYYDELFEPAPGAEPGASDRKE